MEIHSGRDEKQAVRGTGKVTDRVLTKEEMDALQRRVSLYQNKWVVLDVEHYWQIRQSHRLQAARIQELEMLLRCCDPMPGQDIK